MKRNKKKLVRLTESDVYSIVEDAVRQQLTEGWSDKAKMGALGAAVFGAGAVGSCVNDGSEELDRPDQMEYMTSQGYNDGIDALDDYTYQMGSGDNYSKAPQYEDDDYEDDEFDPNCYDADLDDELGETGDYENDLFYDNVDSDYDDDYPMAEGRCIRKSRLSESRLNRIVNRTIKEAINEISADLKDASAQQAAYKYQTTSSSDPRRAKYARQMKDFSNAYDDEFNNASERKKERMLINRNDRRKGIRKYVPGIGYRTDMNQV